MNKTQGEKKQLEWVSEFIDTQLIIIIIIFVQYNLLLQGKLESDIIIILVLQGTQAKTQIKVTTEQCMRNAIKRDARLLRVMNVVLQCVVNAIACAGCGGWEIWRGKQEATPATPATKGIKNTLNAPVVKSSSSR